jgi:hypothetical protein
MIELAIGGVLLAGLVWWQVVIEWRAYRRRKARLEFEALMQAFRTQIHAIAMALGTALLPAVRQVTEAFRRFARAFDELPDEVKDAIRTIDGDSRTIDGDSR